MTQIQRTPDLIGVAEASAILSLDRRTIHRMVERSELEPASKLPGLRGAYIFDRATIVAAKEQQK